MTTTVTVIVMMTMMTMMMTTMMMMMRIIMTNYTYTWGILIVDNPLLALRKGNLPEYAQSFKVGQV